MNSKNLPGNNKYYLLAIVVIAFFAGSCSYNNNQSKKSYLVKSNNEEVENEGGRRRQEYEFRLLRDPKTGKIPVGIRKQELELLKTLPSKSNIAYREQINNTYTAVGPTQNGGRTRAVVFDVRYNGTTNKVIMGGGINGGLFRSVDGGATWSFVSPPNDIRSVSCIAQDPRAGFQDTWYAGTGGEILGSSAADPSSFFMPGYGIFKSIDNGASWTKLTSTIQAGTQQIPSSSSTGSLVDNVFDMVFRIAVHPVTGDVYAAIYDNIARSTNGGISWSGVLTSSGPQYPVGVMTDISINADGSRIFTAFSGRNLKRDTVGVFVSSTGDKGSWTRIAGGTNGSPDSVAGWKSYDNTIDPSTGFTGGYERLVLATAPSNTNLLYVMYNFPASSTEKDADLFKADLTSFTGNNPATITWNNYSANLTAKRNGTTASPLNTQGNYDMSLSIHPSNSNIVIAGGTNIYRSTDGFATSGNVKFIGGYSSNTFTDLNFASHPDIHFFAFDPSSPNRMVVASDGGLFATNDITASAVTWGLFNSQYQTIQYYHVSVDPEIGSQAYAGGAQDNSTTYRDANALFGSPLPDPNDHYILIGGDGGSTGITKKDGQGKQYLFASQQLGKIYRQDLFSPYNTTDIKPTGSGDGQFVTYFHLDEDNTNLLYYVTDNSLYRTKNATTVTTSANWEEVTGIAGFLSGNIYSLATTRGSYTTNSYLFIGTDDNKIYRLKDPANSIVSTFPTDITPSAITTGSVITDIAVNPRNQDTVMFVASNYGVKSIFWTGNATAATPTWQSVEGNISLPSVRTCAIVATTTGIEYYVGTSIGLYSTTAVNGTSTVWINEGGTGMIKTAIVNDLAYRWQDNTLVIGTHGNGMFVTQIGNAITGVNDPIRNDKNFIKAAYPTLTNSQLHFQTGSLTGIKKMQVEILSVSGQLIYKQEYPFRDGSIPVFNLADGNYILNISGDNRRYVFTQKFVKIN
ncbi:MAG: T9SS type A sorting domain-containing protein [Sphingobacteriales bacterium]